jgi:formate-dependent phosphoribosylglycinamide formyltransferase (GAR transformylase)
MGVTLALADDIEQARAKARAAVQALLDGVEVRAAVESGE